MIDSPCLAGICGELAFSTEFPGWPTLAIPVASGPSGEMICLSDQNLACAPGTLWVALQ